jgi:hypothetical protein
MVFNEIKFQKKKNVSAVLAIKWFSFCLIFFKTEKKQPKAIASI